jgi:hypothetical protein
VEVEMSDSAARIVQYSNLLSNGPEGLEYLLPISAEVRVAFPNWLKPYSELSSETASRRFDEEWRQRCQHSDSLSKLFDVFGEVSIYWLPASGERSAFWLIRRSPTHVAFFAKGDDEAVALATPKRELTEILTSCSGVRFGFRMETSDFLRPDSGFLSRSAMQPTMLSELGLADTHEYAESLAIPFYSTPCGNLFLATADGIIAKLDHESQQLTNCFSSASEFIGALRSHLGNQGADETPFTY